MSQVTNHQLVVVVAFIERNGQILLVRRHDPEHSEWHLRWEFPGGKIEVNETPLQALHREIKEETNLTIHSEKLLGVHTHHWNTPKGTQQTFIILYHCLAHPGDVFLNQEENDDFNWENPEEILKKENLLDGNALMLQELFLSRSFHNLN